MKPHTTTLKPGSYKLKRELAHLQELSTKDGLTGVLNRKALDEQLQIQSKQASRLNASLAVAMVDLDHFKKINDTYGHGAGDEVLINFASFLKSKLRQTDIIARYGGEEFTVIFPFTCSRVAQVVMEYLLEEFSGIQHTSHSFQVTFSCGVAGTIQEADQALYRAKAEGRNRVCLAEQELRKAA